MKTWRTYCLFLLILLSLLLLAEPATAAARARIQADALTIANAIVEDDGWVSGASFVTGVAAGADVFTTPLSGFPVGTTDSSYAILSSGNASGVFSGGGSLDVILNNPARNVFDVTILKIDLNAPAGTSCLILNFRFLSKEYPEYVGSEYNDAFIAELDINDWNVSGTTISAPHNFVFDVLGNPVTINSGLFSQANAAGTNYAAYGATDMLVAVTPITAGAHSLYLSIFDMGDSRYDSAVIIDNLHLYGGESCTAGTFPGGGYSLTIHSSGTGSGTVLRNPDKTYYDIGEVITLTAIPSNNSWFAGWSGVDWSLNNTATVTMVPNRTVDVSWEMLNFIFLPAISR